MKANQRVFRVTLAVMLLALGFPAEAQQKEKLYRVGVLGPPGKLEERATLRGLRDGLKEAGHHEGKNLLLQTPLVKTYDELRPIAKTYVETKMEAIITIGGTSTNIAKDATKEIPIIFMGLRDPVSLGFVKSLARPEANITGLTSEPAIEFSGKRLELFKEAVPSLRRVTLLYNARGEAPGHARSVAVVREIAPKLALTFNEKPTKSTSDVDEALRTVSKETSDGIFIICSGLFGESFKKIYAVAIQKKLPAWGCAPDENTLSHGALLSYNPDGYRIGQRGAWYLDKILKGTRPSDLPVEQPTKFELVINLKTAKQIGLTIPPNVLARADKVIK